LTLTVSSLSCTNVHCTNCTLSCCFSFSRQWRMVPRATWTAASFG